MSDYTPLVFTDGSTVYPVTGLLSVKPSLVGLNIYLDKTTTPGINLGPSIISGPTSVGIYDEEQYIDSTTGIIAADPFFYGFLLSDSNGLAVDGFIIESDYPGGYLPSGVFSFAGLAPGVYTLTRLTSVTELGSIEITVSDVDLDFTIEASTILPPVTLSLVTFTSATVMPNNVTWTITNNNTLEEVAVYPFYNPGYAPVGTYSLPAGSYTVVMSNASDSQTDTKTFIIPGTPELRNEFTWVQQSISGELHSIYVSASWASADLASRGEVTSSDWTTIGKVQVQYASANAVKLTVYTNTTVDLTGEIRLAMDNFVTTAISVPASTAGVFYVYWLPGYNFGSTNKTIILQARKVTDEDPGNTMFYSYIESVLVAPQTMLPSASSTGNHTFEAMAQ